MKVPDLTYGMLKRCAEAHHATFYIHADQRTGDLQVNYIVPADQIDEGDEAHDGVCDGLEAIKSMAFHLLSTRRILTEEDNAWDEEDGPEFVKVTDEFPDDQPVFGSPSTELPQNGAAVPE